MIKNSFDSILAWQKSMDFAVLIYEISANFPQEEKYSLISQLRRSASSISANIAEGKGRNGNKELLRFLYIARGSLEECKNHLILSHRLQYISTESMEVVSKRTEEIGKLLNALIRSKLSS